MGPPDELHPIGHLGCIRTFVRRAATDVLLHREWLERSVRFDPIRRGIAAVLADNLNPLEPDQGEWLSQFSDLGL